MFEVDPFSQVDQAEGFDGEEHYRYYEESDIDDHDDNDYNGLTMDELFEMFDAKMEKRFEEQARIYENQARSIEEARIANNKDAKEMHAFVRSPMKQKKNM